MRGSTPSPAGVESARALAQGGRAVRPPALTREHDVDAPPAREALTPEPRSPAPRARRRRREVDLSTEALPASMAGARPNGLQRAPAAGVLSQRLQLVAGPRSPPRSASRLQLVDAVAVLGVS